MQRDFNKIIKQLTTLCVYLYSFPASLNGQMVHSNEVQINASDIQNLEIVATPPEQPKEDKMTGGDSSKHFLNATPTKVYMYIITYNFH